MSEYKKLLVRARLVNWHYFENETIVFNGSTLISGENTAGKSTILDALQLVLTTNTRRFNAAANEKGKRNLKGYVRCKIGHIGEPYSRRNVVPANVALEFYEEKADRYFVLGVHMLSYDEESDVVTKWYAEECRLEDLSFLTESRPSLAEEFRLKGKKIKFIEQKNAARDRFKHRMGNLDEKFFDIIPKSLAFKPMNNVKEFINKFVLPDEKINVQELRENIETLNELENVLDRSCRELSALEEILAKHTAIEDKERDMLLNDFLLKLAQSESLADEIVSLGMQIRQHRQDMELCQGNINQLTQEIKAAEEQILAILIAKENNSSSRMVEKLEGEISLAQAELVTHQDEAKKLKKQLSSWRSYLQVLEKLDYKPIKVPELELLEKNAAREAKTAVFGKLENFVAQNGTKIELAWAERAAQLKALDDELQALQETHRSLSKHILTYPKYAQELKTALENEFERRGITSKIYFLAELLEVKDAKWQNVVEGYLHTQKFYLIVEPEYYMTALEVYNRNRSKLHTAGIINTRKLPPADTVDNKSLAYVVQSENRYAKAYVNYLLGRVMRCNDVKDLENHSVAVTAECMLYQGYVVRHMNPQHYRNPFIGQNAYKVQLANLKKEIELKNKQRAMSKDEIKLYDNVLAVAKSVHIELLRLYMYAPNDVQLKKEQLDRANKELNEAQQDPGLLELKVKLEEKTQLKEELLRMKAQNEKQYVAAEIKEQSKKDILKQKEQLHELAAAELDEYAQKEQAVYKAAKEKYVQNRKTKTASTIAENFAPQKARLGNECEKLCADLMMLQSQLNQKFALDFSLGADFMEEYRQAADKLQCVELVHYEEKLKTAKEDCEQIFRSDFLSKMKEYIETAKNEFRNLNKALNSIYYGDDSYHFKITFNKNKEGLYRMITDENNQSGMSLWTNTFESDYQAEMEDLFAKLMTKDDNGESVVTEYTDYRSYLDYDIEICKRDGSKQKFSDIYGEKSGSETQVPYYVAIAASFYQLYRYGNSVRLMLLDEAFDKMDDERIQSMLEFFNGLGLQVIMATPPAKIDVITEHVGTVLTALRVGRSSIVEEYDV